MRRLKLNNKKKSKKGQVSFAIATFIAFVIGLILVAPIMLRIVGTVTGTFFNTMNESYPAAVMPASDAVDVVYNFFDYLVVIGMVVNLILLFVSSWFIDTHPIFIVMYIMFAFILFLFIPNLMDATDQVWTHMNDASSMDPWEDNTIHLDFTDFIRRNMSLFSLVIIALTGVVIYAKFKIVGGQF